MRLSPRKDYVVLKRVVPENMSRGGIFIPDPEWQDQGDVMAAGPDATVKVGERVVLGQFSGKIVFVDGVEYLVVRDEDLFAVME